MAMAAGQAGGHAGGRGTSHRRPLEDGSTGRGRGVKPSEIEGEPCATSSLQTTLQTAFEKLSRTHRRETCSFGAQTLVRGGRATARRFSMRIILPAHLQAAATPSIDAMETKGSWIAVNAKGCRTRASAMDISMSDVSCTPPCTPGPSTRPQAGKRAALGPRHPDTPSLTGHHRAPPPVSRQQCVSLPQLLPTAMGGRALQRPGSQRGGPTCTCAHCDVRSGCIALRRWRRASQCRPHDRLALLTTHVR